MSSLELPHRSLAVIVVEASVCASMNIISIVGNVLVCLAVYRNPRLRSSMNLYIIGLALSDLLCATVEMPAATTVLIAGHWKFGNVLCQFQGFVDVFVTAVSPLTMGLTAFNRYMRIVQTNRYNKIFSPLKSMIWLSCLWLLPALYFVISPVANWSKYAFIPGYAVCSITFSKFENRLAHYCCVFAFFFVLPFSVGVFSYYKIVLSIRQHKRAVVPSLRNSNGVRDGRISVREVDISRVLWYIAAGFLLCWIPMWAFIIWKRFFSTTAPRIAQQLVIVFLFLSSTINPFIYAATNSVFREEFRKLLFFWRVRRARRMTELDTEKRKDRRNKNDKQSSQALYVITSTSKL